MEERQLNAEQQKLMRKNLRCVDNITNIYYEIDACPSGLGKTGCYHLCLAALDYEESMGISFYKYAYPVVERAIKNDVCREICRRLFKDKVTKEELKENVNITNEDVIKDFKEKVQLLTVEEQYVLKAFIGIGKEQMNVTEICKQTRKKHEEICGILKKAVKKMIKINKQNNK